MRRRLPPLKTLEGFEAAARLGSFAAAADALGLTQSAISHQIRLLELSLGQPLFRRLHRKIVLTDAGEDFQRSVHETLMTLREGVNRLEPYRKPGSVVLYCEAALANAWLGPLLPRLRKRNPKIDIWLDTSGRQVDFEHDEVDILIRRQSEDEQAPHGSAGLRSEILLRDWLRPVTAPHLAKTLRKGSLKSNIRRATLLHEEGFDGWPVWFDAFAKSNRDEDGDDWLARGPNFSDAYVMLQSAAAGLGVALGSTIIAAPFIAAGNLAWLSPDGIPSPDAYVITATDQTLADDEIRQTYHWLREEAAALS
jgi:LysR family glycine cleavage system transcriptional activator